jgi:hypothetical protein
MKILLLLIFAILSIVSSTVPSTIPDPSKATPVECSDDYGKQQPNDDGTSGGDGAGFHAECHPKNCARLEFPEFADLETINVLKTIALKAISIGRKGKQVAGPTIVDINAGYLRDMDGLVNIYTEAGSIEAASQIFTLEEYGLYRAVIDRIRATVSHHFGLPERYPIFTAPTFITRILYDPGWRPEGMHDVYCELYVAK